MALVTDNPLTLTVPGILAVAGQVSGAAPVGVGDQRQGGSVVQGFEHQIHVDMIPQVSHGVQR